MVSISDLSEGGTPEEPDDALTPVQRATLRAENERLAQIAAVLSAPIPTRLDVPRSVVHEITVKQSPAIAIMREQAAQAGIAREDASRPWWKKSGGWSLIVSFVGLLIAILVAWPDIKSWCVAFWSVMAVGG